MGNYNMSAEAGKQMIIKFLNDRMRALNMSLHALSKKSAISEAELSNFFDGSQEISLLNYLKILGALEIRPYLIAREDDDTKMNTISFN